MIDPLNIMPAIDAGSDSFARFRYQAEVTLPFCLRCALNDDIVSVIPEHLEDIAIETEDKWRFLQVKSRNPERDLWKLSDLIEPGGALHSLYRTYKSAQDINLSLELVLEGAVKPRNEIEYLRSDGDHKNLALISSVADGLSINGEEAGAFLAHVVLSRPPVARTNIRDSNLRLMHEQNPSLSHNVVVQVYEKLIAEIERAMRAEPIGIDWPRYVIHPDHAIPDLITKINAKRLTRSYLQQIVVNLTLPATTLLKRITESDSTSVSLLERKLAEGGATDAIIENARYLRSNAQIRLFDFQSRSLFPPDDLINDLNLRLQTYITSKNALHISSPNPAIMTWNSLLSEFSNNASSIDSNKVMNADPMLLLGQVCELSNACLVDWGASNAQ